MPTFASWNMHGTATSWAYLQELRDRHGVDAFLLQEAHRPADPPHLHIEPGVDTPEAWSIKPHRRFCSAIAADPFLGLSTVRPVPLAQADASWGEFVASHPGQFAVAEVRPEGFD